jgi:hypothetical protein
MSAFFRHATPSAIIAASHRSNTAWRIDAIGQHEAAGILEDVLRIRQVQGLAVLHERQRLVAHQTGERRALQHAIARRHGVDRREEP